MSSDIVDNDSHLQNNVYLGVIQAQCHTVVQTIAGLCCVLMWLHQTSFGTGTYETACWVLLPILNE